MCVCACMCTCVLVKGEICRIILSPPLIIYTLLDCLGMEGESHILLSGIHVSGASHNLTCNSEPFVRVTLSSPYGSWPPAGPAAATATIFEGFASEGLSWCRSSPLYWEGRRSKSLVSSPESQIWRGGANNSCTGLKAWDLDPKTWSWNLGPKTLTQTWYSGVRTCQHLWEMACISHNVCKLTRAQLLTSECSPIGLYLCLCLQDPPSILSVVHLGLSCFLKQ